MKMTQHYLIGFLMLVAGTVLEVSSRPSANELSRWPGRKREYGGWSGNSQTSDEYYYNGLNFVHDRSKLEDSSFTLFVKPIAHASSTTGTAIANSLAQVVIARNRSATIIHEPLATAIVGPGGVAHAQSDLYLYEYVTV